MTENHISTEVAIIGGGVVGSALAFTLAHRGVNTILLEAESDFGLAASGTNSGILHTGFDSTPGELETELILRSARRRPEVLEALDVPVMHCGAQLIPRTENDHETIHALSVNAESNGVEVEIRPSDGALIVPGESVTDPVAYTSALAASAAAAGSRAELNAIVTAIEPSDTGLRITTSAGKTIDSVAAINAAGLRADEVARLVGDNSFDIYPRKGEFFVFDLPGGRTLDRILLPVPTKRTKGVLVFPSLDGKVIAGPTAVDLEDKSDWSVRAEASDEVLAKAVEQYPALAGLAPVASYAGLRPAGHGSNYIVAPSPVQARLINVAAIRSTGLTASLGIAEYVAEFLPALGIQVNAFGPISKGRTNQFTGPWWSRTARYRNMTEA